ncbi:Protein-glutamate methylesterase/protein-glutamine glutaminase [Paenibacillus solanacearum]|uniref:Protein-glutamate methylesterase/protein-glutamine glutaminase n=1 Tax=Paenibacillus solanacearum TaxID=2048548 RepID=A0A916JS12_9BACL|nr:helix-turn-helix domain-containing protein [Paenibacillus solanacearum]CAG7598501.1 Protein-glutamate methylesterase/protein-glutamine glutaminase [Paenibacillus solanacearum]
MWNVLLVEDEAFVRRSLRQLVPWEAMGFAIVGEAGDGREALALMHDCSPDLVIADIVMPVMDGIELMKRAREEGLECAFVMLTCMNEFEYARQALEYGASAYLLKLSMNVQAIEETLNKVKRQLVRDLLARSRSHRQPFESVYRDMWQSIAEGKAALWLPTGEEPGGYGRFRSVAIVSFLHGTDRFTPETFLELGIVSPGCRAVLHMHSHFGQTTVFVWDPAAFRPQASRCSIPWPAVYARPVERDELSEAWRRVLRTMDRIWYEGASGFIEADAPDRLPAAAATLRWDTEREWIQSFEQHKADELQSRLQAGWKEMAERRLPMAAVKETALRVDRILALIAGETGTPEEEYMASVSHEELGRRLLSSAERYALKYGDVNESATGHPEIDKALRHIRRHYYDDLTLKSIAALVAMDEAYFSALFKRKTGVTLMHHIQQIRIGAAKRLLERTKLPVAEVGERVGYPNANYFIKIFRRWTGTTPSEYRVGTN